MDYAQRIEDKRQKIVNTLIEFIETNPEVWEKGWYSLPNSTQINALTQKKYRGVNALYLMSLSLKYGYSDPRWLTFNQAKDLGANVRAGEKSSDVFYWSYYDYKTKKPFEEKTMGNMSEEERRQYLKENVKPVIKFYQVFNAAQCDKMPVYVRNVPEMEEDEIFKQNELVEQIISNSEAPIQHDGGDKAYYQIDTDSIHLPQINAFKTMQDYYATALHEIAHSTGHKGRLNRELSNSFGSPNYAREELRAELASVFMQIELGISVEGRHFENHGAYLASWLKAVKNNKKEFFMAAADAEKIADYVSEHYAHEKKAEYDIAIEEPKFQQDKSFEKQVDMAFAGELPKTEAILVRSETPFCLRLVGFNNLPMLITQKHIKDINHPEEENNSQYHGLSVDIIKGLPKYLENPVMIMESMSQNDSIVVVTDCLDHKSRPIIVSVKPNGSGRYNNILIDSNFVTSFYGRKNFQKFIENTIEQNKLLYWDKEKSQKLYSDLQVQFPYGLYNLDSNIIIRKSKALVNSLEPKSQNNLNISENTNKKSDNIEQYQQVGQVEQVGQVGQAEVKKWNKMKIDTALIVSEHGKITKLKMPDGEFSSFVFSVPTKLVYQDKKSGEMQVSVNDISKYRLIKGYMQVELTGAELRQAFSCKEIGKKPQRILSEINAQTLSDIYRNVPEEMRQMPNWCVYRTRWNDEKGKKDKQIYSPVLGVSRDGKLQWASINKPETWATFDEAMKFAQENNCAGLVFALDGNGISCIDLDKSIVKDGKLNDQSTDKANGELGTLAARLCDEMQNTYIETSASGNGIHIFVKDDLLNKGKYKNRVETPDGEIEVYDDKRFISMTGKLLSQTINLGKSPIATTRWLQKTLGERVSTGKIAPPRLVDNSDNAIIERIERSKKGTLFKQLMNGVDVTGDNSRNDFMLLNILAFFSDCDTSQMERIFKSSGLYREEKGEQYVQRSIGKACTTLQTRMSDSAVFGKSKHYGKANSK